MCLAIPMKIVELITPDQAIVEHKGITMEISLKLVENAQVGDYVIVHTGFALDIFDAAEAENTLEILNNIDEISKQH